MWRSRCSFFLSLLIVSLNVWIVFSIAKRYCVDTELTAKCQRWQIMGYCEENSEYSEYMSYACNETCGLCSTSYRPCPANQFNCLDGLPRCVPIREVCDGILDCENGQDEEYDDCGWLPKTESMYEITEVHKLENSTEEPITTDMNAGLDCPENHIACRKEMRCIRIGFWCDGWIQDCADEEDEMPDRCYKDTNKEIIREVYRDNKTSVAGFYETIVRSMRLTHCTARSFSCSLGACDNTVDLNSDLCGCDEDCWARGDCCYDVEEMCGHAKPTHIVESCSPNLFGADTEITALIIDRCPPNSATERDARLCGQRDNNQHVKYYGAPVYSPDTGKHYRNYECARCNGVNTNTLQPWNVWYSCNDCNSLIYVPPPSHHYPEPKPCKTRKLLDPSFDDTVIKVSEKEGLAVERCQKLYAPVKYNGTLYRNPYCVYLHRSQVGDKNKTRLFTCDVNQNIGACPNETDRPCRPTFTCIPEDKICDGVSDCPDDSDEPFEECQHKECYGMFQCTITRHQCFPITKVCDGFHDCQDQSDEENCEDETTNEIVYSNNIYNSLPGLSEYPGISNTYLVDRSKVLTKTENKKKRKKRKRKRKPKCIDPLVFDGINCKYNKTLTAHNQDYQKVYLKQDLTTISYNITLSRLPYYRPEALSDNPPVFLTRHVAQHPYQIVDFKMGELSSDGTRDAYFSLRLLTQLEQSESIRTFTQTKRDKENYIQIGKEVYEVSTTLSAITHGDQGRQLNTLIDCQFDHSGPFIQVICTGCAHLRYTTRDYTITPTGSIQLKIHGKQVLQYYEYELRDDETILVCWEPPNSHNTGSTSSDRDV